MSLKPTDFFIGVIDFFSVILPGALVTYFLKSQYYHLFFGRGKIFSNPSDSLQGWIIFLIATYIIGNFMFAIGSILLDKYVYDKMMRKMFQQNYDLCYLAASAIKEQFLSSHKTIKQIVDAKLLSNTDDYIKIKNESKRELLNTFKWGKHHLSLHHQYALVEINKFVADSKFFRSLVIAFLIIAIILFINAEWISAVIIIIFASLSLYRYADLRYKSTERTYEYIISLENQDKDSTQKILKIIPDNRAKFSLEEKDLPYEIKNRVKKIMGSYNESTLLSIPNQNTWTKPPCKKVEMILCLSGKSVVSVLDNKKGETKVILSPSALLSLPPGVSLSVTNEQEEPLRILSI